MSTAANQCNPFSSRSIRVRGVVQGVGFRPMVWRLAQLYGLSGSVINDAEGVMIEAAGPTRDLGEFVRALSRECPPLARIDHIEQHESEHPGLTGFHILASRPGKAHTGIAPDAATCPACLADTLDPDNRRHRYPFTNCTHCGPRLSIISAIPYDRANTSMATFPLCPDCREEYDNPADRRFHAQPNACPNCGPRVWLEPEVESTATDTIDQACRLLLQGNILAIKGIGGFHLVCDATNPRAVSRLRERKHRYAKPFALMARDMATIRHFCPVTDQEATLLTSPAAPIVLLHARTGTALAAGIAPGQTRLGFMLPYTPLHHLLTRGLDTPLVMTSGNPGNHPQCRTNEEARIQLDGIADFRLLHDRKIVNRSDDSVVRVDEDKPRLLRRARGYAPAPVPLPPGFNNAPEILALGAELKNTFCLLKNGKAVLSQHLGDLENAATLADFENSLTRYQRLFSHEPVSIAIDCHPDYFSSRHGKVLAESRRLPLFEVQHHHAHIGACLAENGWPIDGGKVLGIALDGLGYGDDGQLWGGEFLLADYRGFERLAHLKPVALPGGAQAMREPWRNTYAHLVAALGWERFAHAYHALPLFAYLQNKPVTVLDAMIHKGLNTPQAASTGRLFDAVAAAIGVCPDRVSYEGQAAMELEALVDVATLETQREFAYPMAILTNPGHPLQLDPGPLWEALLMDLAAGEAKADIAARFHLGLATAIAALAVRLIDATHPHLHTAALSGGVFQNAILCREVSRQLQASGLCVLRHAHIPANDGGIALGQAAITAARMIQSQEAIPCV